MSTDSAHQPIDHFLRHRLPATHVVDLVTWHSSTMATLTSSTGLCTSGD